MKIKLLKVIVTPITLYGCETWMWTRLIEHGNNDFGMRYFGRLLSISWKEHRTNESFINAIQKYVEECEPLIQVARRQEEVDHEETGAQMIRPEQ